MTSRDFGEIRPFTPGTPPAIRPGMSRLTEAPPWTASTRHSPVIVRVPTVKVGKVVDILANAALRWLCRSGARRAVPVVLA